MLNMANDLQGYKHMSSVLFLEIVSEKNAWDLDDVSTSRISNSSSMHYH